MPYSAFEEKEELKYKEKHLKLQCRHFAVR
jgi:hypothetical protein